jgi:hypothetical protein
MFAMSKNSEIPCSACHKWNATAKSFSCNPHQCQQLSEWFIVYTKIDPMETIQVVAAQIQYIV